MRVWCVGCVIISESVYVEMCVYVCDTGVRFCRCVCVYVCMNLCGHVCGHDMHIYAHTYVVVICNSRHAFTYIHIHTHTRRRYVRGHVPLHALCVYCIGMYALCVHYGYVYVHVLLVCTYVCSMGAHIYTYMYIYIYIYIYIYVYICHVFATIG